MKNNPITILDEKITKLEQTAQPDTAEIAALCVERGRQYLSLGRNDLAMNDFLKALTLDPHHKEAEAYKKMLDEIWDFRYWETFNV